MYSTNMQNLKTHNILYFRLHKNYKIQQILKIWKLACSLLQIYNFVNLTTRNIDYFTLIFLQW
jgi:hypothetical protein